MTTEIYGASDDLIEFGGDIHGEVSHIAGEDDRGTMIICSDNTLLNVKYGKDGRGIWTIILLRKGSLFESIDQCDDEDAERYSDTARFKDGLKWAYAAHEWESVR